MPAPRTAAALAAWACLFLAGCALVQVKEDQEKDDAIVRLKGTVSVAEPGEGALVVVLTRRPARGEPEYAIVDYHTRETEGAFYFAVLEPGVYSVAAFQDRNGDLVYNAREPGLNSSDTTTYELVAGDTEEGIELVIHPDDRIPLQNGEGYDIRAWVAEAAAAGIAITNRNLSTIGEVVDLADARFGTENGRRGLWEAWDFIFEGLQGVYFVEPYDPRRTPVLFVHGISGYPQEFSTLIERLDRERYQPWFFFYASGEHLYKTAELLVQLVMDLRMRHGFERMVVVAHSMGGLLSRDFLLQYQETTGRDTVPTFVSISTPWGGHSAANSGVEHSPVVVYTWEQMATNGEYIRSLFYKDPDAQQIPRRFPEHLTHHLIFGVVDGASDDGVVAITSELHPPAQAQAATIYGVMANHTEILHHDLTIELVNSYLAEAPL